MKAKSVLIFLIVILTCSSLSIAQASDLTFLKDKTEFTAVDESFTESQVEYKFPEDNITSRKYARYRRVFKGYEGRGTIYVENHGAETAEVYINGYKIPVDNVLKTNDGKAQIDIGKYTQNGANTLAVFNISPEDSYIYVKVFYPELISGLTKNHGPNNNDFSTVDNFINAEIKQGFPGAVLLVLKDGEVIKNTAYGVKMLWDGFDKVEKPEPVTVDTMYDLASNTKMFATNLALMKLVSEGKVKTSDAVSDYLDDFVDGPDDTYKGKASITLADLMHHCAGFPADPQYFNPKVAGDLYSQDKATTITMLSKTPLIYTPGTKTVYSDVDYMILGVIIEKITGMPLDQYVEDNIYKPLGLTQTVFNPTQKGFSADDCAATERNGNTRDGLIDFPNIRTQVIQGEVHDEKAYYCMGGVSGHAGLFSTTHDLAVLAQLILNGGGYGGYKLCDKDTLQQFIKPSDNNDLRGLGWDRNADSKATWEFGAYASNLTIGHTGWTGTVTCIDPANDMAIILLTNERNMPCPNGKFDSDAFETGRYGSILSLVEEAILNKGDDKGAGLIQAANDQLKIAQNSKNELDIKEAEATIDILPEGNVKRQLRYELFLLKTNVIPTAAYEEAGNLVLKAEQTLEKEDLDDAKKYVEALPESDEKDILIQKTSDISSKDLK